MRHHRQDGMLLEEEEEEEEKTQRKRHNLYSTNTTGYRGVYKNRNRFRAQIQIDGVCHHLGNFDTRKEAAIAFDRAAIQEKRPISKMNYLDQVPKNYKPKMKKLLPRNTSGYRGVHKMGNKFNARVMIDGNRQNLGNFDTAKEAAIAWDRVAIKGGRPRTVLNFPNNMKQEISKRKHNRKHSSTKRKMRIIRVSTYFDGRANHLRTFAKVLK